MRGVPIFFFNDTATTEIYTLSLHDALPIWDGALGHQVGEGARRRDAEGGDRTQLLGRGQRHHLVRADRKSTRLNSSHANISYAVFCLKKNTKPGTVPDRSVDDKSESQSRQY